MRGLVVVAILVAGLLLLNSYMGTATDEGESYVVKGPEFTCTQGNGTEIVLKTDVDVEELSVEGVCNRGSVPAGWTLHCKTSESLREVEVRFSVGGEERRTVVVCS